MLVSKYSLFSSLPLHTTTLSSDPHDLVNYLINALPKAWRILRAVCDRLRETPMGIDEGEAAEAVVDADFPVLRSILSNLSATDTPTSQRLVPGWKIEIMTIS